MLAFLVTMSGQPQKLTSIEYGSSFKDVTFYGYKAFLASGIPQNNTSTCYVGYSTGQLPVSITAGGSAKLDTAPPYAYRDNLATLWAVGFSGDGIFVLAY